MAKDKLQIYSHITNSIAQLLALVKLYTQEHPVVKTKIAEVFKEFSESGLDKESLIFSVSEGGIFLVNGEEIRAQDGLISRFVEAFHNLRIGSLDLESGLSLEEFNCFIDLLNRANKLQDEGQLKQYLKEKGVKHLVPSLAIYKLIKENETIVKERGILKIQELPPELVSRFLEDLKKGEVNKQLQAQSKTYQVLAHDPTTLSQITSDLIKDNSDDLVRVLWLIGDYLLDEIGTVKEEEINRKVLNELKERLLSLWGQKPEKAHLKEEIQKTFTGINAALQIKGLILLYQKHKKGLESVADKLKEILKLLPPESQLYRKTKEDLEKIGVPSLDPTIFKPEAPL